MNFVGEEETTGVKKGFIKQDDWITDASVCCKIVTWEDNVGPLVVGELYKLSGLVVRHTMGRSISFLMEGYHNRKHRSSLIVPKEQATEKRFTGVSIVGVRSIVTLDSCYF